MNIITNATPNFLSSLNTAQYEAVVAPLGPVRVLAGAGSGKTKVLTSRIAWLIETGQAKPHTILAVTFTNKAAFEMRLRLEKLLNTSVQNMWIGTFHSLCHRFLRMHFQEASLSRDFQVLDSDDQLRLCKRILKVKQIDEKKIPPKMLAHFIGQKKDQGLRAQHVDAGFDPISIALLEAYFEYQTICEQSDLVDFSEIILRTLETLRSNDLLLKHYQQRFSDILVDEFQDTNDVQFAWVKLLMNSGRRLFVVGDDDQSIYGWRGAKIENILRFDQDFTDAVSVALEQNYRSTPHILAAANHVIAKNIERLDKKLWTEDQSGELVSLYCALDAYDEASFVLESIKAAKLEGEKLADLAILYRSNAQSRLFEEALLKARIPYRVYGGFRFFDRVEIKDVLAFVRISLNPNDDLALERTMTTPPKGIGQASIDKIRALANVSQISLWQSILSLLESQKLAARIHTALSQFKAQVEMMQDSLLVRNLADHVEFCLEHSNLKSAYNNEAMGRGEDRIENLQELLSAVRYFMEENERMAIFDKPAVVYESEAEYEGVNNSIEEDLTINSQSEQNSNQRLLSQFLADITLDSTETQANKYEDCVQLMTLHAAKGLEFAQVFMVGMEEGLFPSEASSYESSRLEEERRLAYVGITRAEKKLFITCAERRMWHGKEFRAPLSRFIKDIPDSVMRTIGPAINIQRPQSASYAHVGSAYSNNRFNKAAAEQTIQGYRLGQTVTHEKFGEGVIMAFEGNGSQTRVIVQFAKEGRKILVLSYARLIALD